MAITSRWKERKKKRKEKKRKRNIDVSPFTQPAAGNFGVRPLSGCCVRFCQCCNSQVCLILSSFSTVHERFVCFLLRQNSDSFTVSLCIGGDWWCFHSYQKTAWTKFSEINLLKAKYVSNLYFDSSSAYTNPVSRPSPNIQQWRPKLDTPVQNFKEKRKKEKKIYRSQTLVNNNLRNYAWLLISAPPTAVSLQRFWRLPSRCRSSLKLIGFGAVVVFTKSAYRRAGCSARWQATLFHPF